MDVLKEKLKIAVRKFYVEDDSAAIHCIESIAASIGRATSMLNKEAETECAEAYVSGDFSAENLSQLLEYCKAMKMSYSYKPVLIMALLHAGDKNGCISIERAATYFQEYYSDRKAQGLPIEKRQCVFLRDDVTDKQIIANLLANPVKALVNSEYFAYDEDSQVFSFSPRNWSALDESGKAAITKICRQKLKDYYGDQFMWRDYCG